jgi:predicted membrane-bound mannosyltransferase
MLKSLIFFVICLFFYANKVNAQTQGCLVSGVLYNTSAAVIPNTACGWATPAAAASTWTNSQKNQCISYGGVAGGYNQIPCPLDDYVPYIVAVIGGLGFIYIRNNNCFEIIAKS